MLYQRFVRPESQLAVRYQVAFAAVAIAASFGLNVALAEVADVVSLPLLLAAVLFCAWFAGSVSGLLCLMGCTVIVMVISAPRYEIAYEDYREWLRAALFAMVSVLVIGIDNLRRRSAQEELRSREALLEKEDRLKVALEAGRMGAFEWTIASQVLKWDAQVDALRGIESEGFEGTINDLLEMVTPEDREPLQREVTRSLAAGAPDLNAQYRVRSADGSVRWVSIKGRVERDKNKWPLSVVGVAWDDTDRKVAEIKIRESEERFRTMADAAPVLIWLSGPDNRRTWFNKTWLECTGRTMEQELGEGWMDGIQAEDGGQYKDVVGTAFAAHKEFEVEYRLRRNDGEYRWTVDRGEPRFGPSGDFAGYIGSAVDIHERRAEQDRQRFLTEAGKVLAATLDYDATLQQVARLPIPSRADFSVVHIVDASGKLRRAAHYAVDPVRLEALDALLQKYAGEEMPDHPAARALRDGRPCIVEHVSKELVASTARDGEHLRLLLQAGPGSAISVPMVAHGKSIGVITLVMGTATGRRFGPLDALAAQAFAQRSAFALLSARLYQESQEIQEDLRVANAAKDDFLSMVSHELRTPLTTMSSGARLLLGRHDQLADDTKKEILKDVQHETERLQLIVENLLALARAEFGAEIEPEPIAIRRAVADSIERISKLSPGRPVSFDKAGPAYIASGVPLYTELVLRNILDNADKYSPAGEPIDVAIRDVGGAVQISIRDHGAGVTKEEEEKIFERFYRSKAASSEITGTGIGLAVCRRLIESQGGEIRAENADGGGLCVTFSLPHYADILLEEATGPAMNAVPEAPPVVSRSSLPGSG